MQILIDTNIILDALLKRSPFDKDAYGILKLAEKKEIEAHIAAFSMTDIYYFISKHLDGEKRIKAIRALLNILKVVSITMQDIEKAMAMPGFTDLEDALQMQCLKKIKGEFIVTRDEKFRRITSKAISPKDFIKGIERD